MTGGPNYSRLESQEKPDPAVEKGQVEGGEKPSISMSKWLKWGSFLILIFQSSTYGIVTRYSRIILPKEELYIASTAVVMSECFKFVISIIGFSIEQQSAGKSLDLFNHVFGPNSDYLAMTVPAALYFVQNILQLTAQTYLDPATFQVTSQLKLLTTAFFSIIWLGAKISLHKWASLFLIFFGICIVQVQNTSNGSKKEALEQMFGLFCVLISCCLSGFAGIWFEKALKGKKVSLFLRNIQLSLFSIVPGLLFAVYIVDGAAVAKNGFFYGYTSWAWGSIIIQSFGGILVAVVVKYSDTIMKVIATTLAIIVSSILSTFIFDFTLTGMFVLGAILVIIGTFAYIKNK